MPSRQTIPESEAGRPAALAALLRQIVSHRWVQVAAVSWLMGYVVVVGLTQGVLPFDRPAVDRLPFFVQIGAPTVTLLEIFVLMLLTYFLTRGRAIPDMGARAPERARALRETVLVLGYAALGQLGGWLIGPAFGFRPFSFHIAGTVFGCSTPPGSGEFLVWATYNFLVFAVLPYLWCRRIYTPTQLNLRSTNRRNDFVLIVAVVIVESAFELLFLDKNLFSLNPHQMLIGGLLTLFLFSIGTVLPTMVLIYSILLPRFVKLTGSAISTVLLAGLTYASMHLIEGWSLFDSPRDTVLSLLFVLLQYVGPGMFKAVLTLRTGNAWVHAISYHAIAPHVIVDAPLVVKAFAVR